MAVRILTCTGLLYEDLIRRGALSAQGKLPPVLPIVLCNGERRRGAAREVGELIARVGGALLGHQPSQRHIVVEAGSYGTGDLPASSIPRGQPRIAARTGPAQERKCHSRPAALPPSRTTWDLSWLRNQLDTPKPDFREC